VAPNHITHTDFDLRSGNVLFKPKPFPVQAIACHIKYAIVTGAIILLRGTGREFNQLFLRKMPSQFGIELVGDVGWRVGHCVSHAQQSPFPRHKSFEVSLANRLNLIIT
jgi:hypothetical protein